MKLLVLLIAAVVVAVFFVHTRDKTTAEIEAKYDVSEADYLALPPSRIRFRDTGRQDAPVVVLLHGFGSSLETWDAWAAALSVDFRVVRFDWPGSGLSSPDAGGDYRDARSLKVLADVLDRLSIDRAVLVGNSMGGKLAWMFTARHPARVSKLVLISPDGFASPGSSYGKQPNVPVSMRLLPYILPRSLLRLSLQPAFGNPALMTDALVERYRDFMRSPGVRSAMISRMEQGVVEDPEPALRLIRAPTLLLWGESDRMIPVGNAKDFLRLMPHARLASLPGLGHVPQEEAPDAALLPVRTFLENADGSSDP